jgi:cell division protein FtsW
VRKTKKPELTIEEQLARGPLDLPFLMLTLLLVGIGLVMVLSASYASAYYSSSTGHNARYFFNRQAAFAVAGIGAMYMVSRLNYQRWRGLSIFVLGGAIVLLLLVKVPGMGVTVNGATRWLRIPGLPQFQPSEIAKLAVILYFSARLSKRKEGVRHPYDSRSVGGKALNKLHDVGFLELVPYGGVLLLILALLSLQPHMSATILILVVGASILFAAGISVGWFGLAGGLMAGLLWIIISTTEYMTRRINLWRNPWEEPLDGGLQAIQSLLAIGSGGLMGLGLGNSRQKFLYLPEEHNDFIFSIACEELGLIGAGLILILFSLLIIRGYWLALHARDRFGSLLIVGVTTLLAFQVFLNVAVVTNLFPVTGISLPFFSYGGSALLIQLTEMGIVLAVSRQIPAQKSD